MRFPSKVFVRVSFLFIFATPTLAHAELTPEQKVEAAKKAHYLTLDEAKAAFGSEFSTKFEGSTVTLYGGSSKECLNAKDPSQSAFSVEKFEDEGKFKIFYNGTNDACLKFGDATKGVGSDAGLFQGLSDLPEGKFVPKGSFDKVTLAWNLPLSTKKKEDALEIPTDDGKSISHLSDADLAKKKKAEEDLKKQTQIDTDVLLVTKCHRGLKELDVGESALARLKGIPEIVSAHKDDKFFDEKSALFRKEKFAACSKQILQAKADDIAASECEDRLKKIASEDSSYTAKVKDLYLKLVNRYLNSTSMDIQEAYAAATATIAKLRDGYDLSEKESSDLDATERNLQLRFLRLAATQGTNSDAFKAMKANMLAYMVAHDAEVGCIDEDTGAVLPAQRMNAACADSQWLSLQLGQQVLLANANQLVLDKQAAAAKKQGEDAIALQNCSVLRASGTVLSASEDSACKVLESAASKAASDAANGSLNSAGGGFGAVVQTPSTDPEKTAADQEAAKAKAASGLLDTAYTASVKPAANSTTTSQAVPGKRRLSR